MDVAIVTGSSRGIGRATAIRLSQDFYTIVNYMRNEKKAMETVAMIENLGRKAMMVKGDVSNYEDAKNIVKKASEFGDIRILVNNAGVYDIKPFSSSMPSEWERIFQVNVFGIMNMIHASLDYMDKGVIVNIASMIGIYPIPYAAAYCASKSAVITLTKSLAHELAPHIKVVCVSPKSTDTDMFRKYHPNTPADSPDKVARYIMEAIKRGESGDCITVD